jgi:UDP-glucose 4-epimerase
MRVLVTGGAGFIGSNLVNVLMSAGHDLGVIDDLSTGSIDKLNPAAWSRVMDIRDPRLAQVVAEFAPEAVVHLAAQVDVGRSIADPALDESINVGGTRAVAAAAREAGARLMLTASSAAVYGPDVAVPTLETAPKAPTNPYGAHKLASEAVLAEEFGGSGRDFAALRFSNVYGPRQTSQGEGGVVAIFSDRMLRGEPVTVYGDGSQTRDFIHVADIADLVMTLLETDAQLAADGPDGPAYNVSTGVGTSIDMLVRLMRGVAGVPGELVYAPPRPGDIHDSALSPVKIRERVGFSAGVELAAGLDHTMSWFARELRNSPMADGSRG